MFIRENNSNCCNYKFCNNYNDLDDEGKECPYLIEVEPVRHGHWEWLGPNFLVKDCFCGTCSVCGTRNIYLTDLKFCPHCGTKMDEVK